MPLDINTLVELASQKHASDIHIICDMPVKCRIDGNIVDVFYDNLKSAFGKYRKNKI